MFEEAPNPVSGIEPPMATLRILLIPLLLAGTIPGRALAIPCGDLQCDSYNGRIAAHEGTSPVFPVVPLPSNITPGSLYYTPQRIIGAMVGSAFAPPNQTQLFIRNSPSDRNNTPTDYATLGDPLGPSPVAVGDQNSPLTLDPSANFGRPPATPAPYQYGLVGIMPGLTPFDQGGTGTLSLLYDAPQYLLGFDVYGVNPYGPLGNPNSFLYVAFFADDGTLIDNITLNLINMGTDNRSYPLYFEMNNGRNSIKGITISSTDRSGVSLMDFVYDPIPEPPLLALLALPLALLLRRQRRLLRSA